MSAKHTPGPWVIDWNLSRLDVFSSDGARLVASLRRSAFSDGLDKSAIANARLIAAAPRMYAVIEAGAKAGDAECIEILEAINGRR